MLGKIAKAVIGTRNQRLIKRYRKTVKRINALEPTIQALSDAELKAKTAEFKTRLAKGEALDQLLPEAFAVCREAAVRTMSLRHFDVQLIGAMVLHENKIAEMRTGEGKTLMSTLAVYLNALSGQGVHVVTVNDYLAERDANWMRPIYEFLGLQVGINLPNLSQEQKQAVYAADVTYGTNNEFGFDYLRDNMVYDLSQRVQRGQHYAIVDEVDSILIDEARTPLIISGQADESSDHYKKLNQLVPKLKRQMVEEDINAEEPIPEADRGDFYVDEKHKQVHVTEQGHQHIEELLAKAGMLAEGSSLYDIHNVQLMHYVMACLRAHYLYQRDVEYLVRDGQIMIIDEHTGRVMEGRRWSDGLHQAVEAKEGVKIQQENLTLASITFQNYFRLYHKLAGMTGTADTEAYELQKIYGLEVVVIPTNKPIVRKDHADKIFIRAKYKFENVIEDIKNASQKGQPVLVGTASVEASELVSGLLKKAGIKHQVLNAKQHEKEAGIIAQAGRPGAVTIATNMAGRGTDIVLGGNFEAEIAELNEPSAEEIADRRKEWEERHAKVIEAGGLHVIATERHESRRIDNQLRGRSGRQGDPGETQFYLSMEDNLLRIFAGERLLGVMRRLGVKDDEMIQHSWITRSIENAQRKVESLNFDIRKNLLEFDDVANDQRKVIYSQRNEILQRDDISESITKLRTRVVENLVETYIPANSIEDQWDLRGLEAQILQDFNMKVPVQQWLEEDDEFHPEDIPAKLIAMMTESYAAKEQLVGAENMRMIEKSLMLQTLDQHWREHLANMEQLRQGIHLRSYAQKNPTQEFKRESFDMFTGLLDAIKHDVIATLTKIEINMGDQPPRQEPLPPPPKMTMQHGSLDVLHDDPQAEDGVAAQPVRRDVPKVGRNDACPCGSGKKYKQCHGQIN